MQKYLLRCTYSMLFLLISSITFAQDSTIYWKQDSLLVMWINSVGRDTGLSCNEKSFIVSDTLIQILGYRKMNTIELYGVYIPCDSIDSNDHLVYSFSLKH